MTHSKKAALHLKTVVAPGLIADYVAREIARASTIREGRGYASAHEAYGVLLEEVEEFFDEVKKKRGQRDKRKMLEELVQVACVAQTYAAQLKLEISDSLEVNAAEDGCGADECYYPACMANGCAGPGVPEKAP